MAVSTHEPVARVHCAEWSGSEKHEGDVTDDNFKGTSTDLSTPKKLVQGSSQSPKSVTADAATEGKTVQLNADTSDVWRVRPFSVNKSLHCFSTISASCRVFAITPKLSTYT